ncbi:MAG: hypothetical protein HYU36_11390 [Planctomycetes bacterium]|nr:hypothetical protein [Planctomycetota bacterium]
MSLSLRSVGITGVGVVSPVGTGAEAFARSLWEGLGASGPLTLFPDAGTAMVSEVKDFRLEEHIETVKAYIDRASALALAACAMARRDAGWKPGPEQEAEGGLALGTSWGCMTSMGIYAEKYVQAGPRLVPPLVFTHAYANAPNSLASIEYSLRGFNACFSGGHACGLQAVSYGADQIRLGRCRFLLAGGADALSPFVLQGYRHQGRLADASRPFDASSTGFLLGEGAAVLALEPATTAAPGVRAVLAGSGLARSHDPSEACLEAMRCALAEAGIGPSELGLIFASANGERAQDQAEADALNRLLSLKGPPTRPPVYALKALMGETMGAGGPLSLAAAVLILTHGRLPASAPGFLARWLASEPPGPASRPFPRSILINSLSADGVACSVVIANPQSAA